MADDDNNVVPLPTKAYEEFCDSLDAPANPNAALQDLLLTSFPLALGDCFTVVGNPLVDAISLLNIRDWMRTAIEAKGAKFIGGGVGGGVTDLDIELEGYQYNITIRPILK